MSAHLLPANPQVFRGLHGNAYAKIHSAMQAKVSVNVHWDHVFFWVLQVVSMCVYLGLRLWYLASGESARFTNGDISIPYSWMVLIADFGLSGMSLYLHQKFWKQTVQFRPLNDLDIQRVTKVRDVMTSDVLFCAFFKTAVFVSAVFRTYHLVHRW